MSAIEVFGLVLSVLALLAFVGGLCWACLGDLDARDCGVDRESGR